MDIFNLPGLTNINIELTSRCNKKCWMCGRRKVEKHYPELAMNYGDIDFTLLEKIVDQLPPRIMVQLHNNGESLLYPYFGDAIELFRRQTTNIVSNGKLLIEKSDEIINNLDTLAISIIENDPEGEEQLKIIEEFLKLKGDRPPYTILRLNGMVSSTPYDKFHIPIARRTIHAAMGSFNYRKNPTIPEVGICLDFLSHMAINKDGKASICVRFDPKGLGIIGDLNVQSLDEVWNGNPRMEWFDLHKSGKRKDVPLCSYCHFWGIPTGGDDPAKRECEDEQKLFGKKERD